MNKIVPSLWFNDNAEEAARFYTDVFKDSKLLATTYYANEGKETHGHDAGDVLTVEFEIFGQRFMGLNGGPLFKFSEAVSFMIECEDQAEIDYYWEKLSAAPDSEQCGWLKDKFGISWQVVPKALTKMEREATPEQRERLFAAFMPMKKINISELESAYNNV
jgi:predicted 3-demethylubiquinone-9 3-methyltransferase (glyoxalase superfamily)